MSIILTIVLCTEKVIEECYRDRGEREIQKSNPMILIMALLTIVSSS